MTDYVLAHAWRGQEVVEELAVRVEGGRFAAVGGPPAPGAVRLDGLVVPGFANGHSHVFHRALRGRTHAGRGDFWTWREQMYAVAERLDPDSLHALARAVFAEMLCAGWVAVGEFHYLHHDPGGRPYADPNELGRAVVAAAREVGIRIALLDTCYLAAGFGRAPEGVQRRFSDGDAAGWAERVAGLADLAADDGVVVGAAIHSVRAVPRDQLAPVAEAAAGRPLHVHLSEQVAENSQCLAAHGATPAQLLDDAGAVGPDTTAVHATHLTGADVALLAEARANACFCPTTERDLGDGIGPARRLHDAGVTLTVGSDSHAVVDPLEELRCLELHERLASQSRGVWPAPTLLQVGAVNGHRSLGFSDAGAIEVGNRADLVVLDTGSVRTAGAGATAEAAVHAAGAADVLAVMVDGQLHDVPTLREQCSGALADAIAAVW